MWTRAQRTIHLRFREISPMLVLFSFTSIVSKLRESTHMKGWLRLSIVNIHRTKLNSLCLCVWERKERWEKMWHSVYVVKNGEEQRSGLQLFVSERLNDREWAKRRRRIRTGCVWERKSESKSKACTDDEKPFSHSWAVERVINTGGYYLPESVTLPRLHR